MTDNYKTSEVGPGSLKAFGNGLFTLAFTVAINELLCLKNDINVFHIKWIIGNHGIWKNQNPGGRFGATS